MKYPQTLGLVDGSTLRRLAVASLLALVAALLAACGPHEFRGTVIEPPNPAKDFALTDQSGQPFRLSEQGGKVVTIFFGFTNCPDICPTSLADMAAVREKLGSDAENLEVLFITVDPERDTAERLGRYMQMFDPSFTALTGSRADLEQVFKDYGVTAIKRELPDSALGYTMDHSAFTYVIDAAGNLRLLFSHGASIDDMTSDLRYLLQEGA